MVNDPFEIHDKKDLRGVSIIILLVIMGGSWAIFLYKVPFDPDSLIDGAALTMMWAGMIIGSTIGAFAWMGIRQGNNQNQIPPIQIPEGHEMIIQNGIVVIRKKP